MTKKDKLQEEISAIRDGLNSDLEENFKISLRDVLKQKEKELADLKDESPKPAPAKKPEAGQPAKKSPKDVLANCREILAKHNKEKKNAKQRVEKRKKEGKPAQLTPAEVVSKTAKSVKAKVVDMKDREKSLPASEVDKLTSGIISTIKSTLEGIKDTTKKHDFLFELKKEIGYLYTHLSKVAMDGGMFADGGALDGLMGDINAPVQNVGGTLFSTADLTSHLDFNANPMFKDGGQTNFTKKWKVVGIDLYGKHFEKVITLGRMSNENDVMMQLRRMNLPIREVTMIKEYEQGGLADYYEKKKYRYEEGGLVDENTEMLLSQIKEIKHHAEEIQNLIENNTMVEAWVVAKAERSATDLSDITHYIDGKKETYAEGGEIKWQDVQVGDSANVKAENKTGVIVHTYGRKFNVKFVDGSEKTYDASELNFIKNDEELFAEGGRFNEGRAWTLDHYQHNNAENYEVPTNDRKYADGGEIDPNGMIHALQNNISAGFIMNYTNAKTYPEVDDIRGNALEILYIEGDRPYSVEGLAEVLKRAERKDFRSTISVPASQYAEGGETSIAEERKELKEIIKKEYPTFVKLLGENIKDPKFRKAVTELSEKYGSVKYKIINRECKDITPTQNEISIEKSLGFPLTSPKDAERYLKAEEPIRIKGNTIITCDNGKYVIDGHHRWSQVYVLNPNAKMSCTDFYELKNPIKGLKATQLGISADLGDLPTSHVHDTNLLTASEETIKNYVRKHITEEVREVFKENGISNPEEHIWKNVLLMRKHNDPIDDAPKRDVMPQTDRAKDFEKYTPKKLKDGGSINDKYQIKSDKGYYSRSMSTGKAVFLDSSEMGYTFTKEEAEKMLERLEKETGKELQIVKYKPYKMAEGGEIKKGDKLQSTLDEDYVFIVKNVGKNKIVLGYADKKMFPYNDFEINKKNIEEKLKGGEWVALNNKMAEGGKTTFNDKVKAIAESQLKRKKVPAKVQKDYGKTFSKKEAIESAKRIAGAMRKKEMAKKKR